MDAPYSSKISEMMQKPKRTLYLYQKLQSEPENSCIKSVDMKFRSFETLLSEIQYPRSSVNEHSALWVMMSYGLV
jgi:hypothetical protein